MKHNNLKVLALGFASLMLVATPALAAEVRTQLNIGASNTGEKGRMEDRKAELEIKRDERKMAFASGSASSTQVRREKMEDKIEKRASSTAARMTATVGRLETIITRIESRIAKVKAAGGTTVEAETAIAAAKVNLASAKTDISAFASVTVSDESGEKFQGLKAAAAKVKADLKSAHTNLMKAVRSLNMSARSGVKATSTASTTAQ